MDSAISIAAMTTALTGTVAVPFITAYFTNSREAGSRADDPVLMSGHVKGG